MIYDQISSQLIAGNVGQVDTSAQATSTMNDNDSMLDPNEDIDDPSANFRDTEYDVPLLIV